MEETVGAAGACVLVAIVTVMVVALIVDGDDSAKVNNGQPDATAPVLVVPTQLPSSRDGYVRKPSSTADDDESFQSLSTDDAYNDGYGCGYEQGCDDGANGLPMAMDTTTTTTTTTTTATVVSSMPAIARATPTAMTIVTLNVKRTGR